jgi:hypothetical protein
MPSPRVQRHGETRCTFTREELLALGITAKEHPYESSSDAVVDVTPSTNSHGTAYDVVFKHGDDHWRITVGYHHEDWEGTNDLHESRLEATLVVPEVVTTTVYRAVREP